MRLGRGAREPDLGEGLLEGRRRHPSLPELGLDPIRRGLLGGREADGVVGSAHLVLVDHEDPGGREPLEEREEDPLVEAPEPRPQLLLGHPRLEGLARVERRERRGRLRADLLGGLDVDVPLPVHDEHALPGDQRLEVRPQGLGAERRSAPGARPCGFPGRPRAGRAPRESPPGSRSRGSGGAP